MRSRLLAGAPKKTPPSKATMLSPLVQPKCPGLFCNAPVVFVVVIVRAMFWGVPSLNVMFAGTVEQLAFVVATPV